MKILCMSDLHIQCKHDKKSYTEFVSNLFEENEIDIVVVTGDVFETNYNSDPYGMLHSIFQGKKVIFTLGNHEFFYRTVQETLDHYKRKYKPDDYDVHCLDIVHSVDVENLHFFGNVLWYDGSMSTVYDQKMQTFADGRWADRLIKDLDFFGENKRCVKLIKENIGEERMINILCTHMCPAKSLNLHMFNEANEFNAYSGMSDLLKTVNADYAICGHTHRRTIGNYIHGTSCINVGNCYYPPYEYYILDLSGTSKRESK